MSFFNHSLFFFPPTHTTTAFNLYRQFNSANRASTSLTFSTMASTFSLRLAFTLASDSDAFCSNLVRASCPASRRSSRWLHQWVEVG